ncbi:MAG: hypothetical protein ACI93R_000167 [Flavobacteriales bacterium]
MISIKIQCLRKLSLLLSLVCISCGGGGASSTPIQTPNPNPSPTPSPAPVVRDVAVLFQDSTSEIGISFVKGYVAPTEGSMAEIFGGGVAVGDFENDNDEDLFIVRGGILAEICYT